MSVTHFSKELAYKYKLKVQDVNAAARFFNVKMISNWYLWTDGDVAKLEKLIGWGKKNGKS